jgi:hypothetical protein
MDVRIGDVTFMNISIPATGTSSLLASQGATVSPSTVVVATSWTNVVLDIPCQNFNGTTLSFVHITPASGTAMEMKDISIPACFVETCGGQNFTCPGLKATQACTPGRCFDYLDSPRFYQCVRVRVYGKNVQSESFNFGGKGPIGTFFRWYESLF